jgi:hypothetical protein
MKHTPIEHLTDAKASLAHDVANLRFDGVTVTGRHGLLSANLKTRRLFFYRVPGDRPLCVLKIPAAGNAPALINALTHPALRGWGSLDGMDDLTSVLWAFINIVDFKAPIDLRSVTISPEAAEVFTEFNTRSRQ